MADVYGNLALESDDYRNADANRNVEIRFHKNAATKEKVLSWHGGKGARKTPPIILKHGMTITVPIHKARGWFGWFTIPHDLEGETDERKIADLRQLFMLERDRTLLFHGDYPRPRKVADGTEPIGPHRFPDVEVRVVEADGIKWEWIRLHELYRVGDFDPMQYAAPPSAADRADEMAEMRAMLKRQEGQIAALTALLSGKVPAKGPDGAVR